MRGSGTCARPAHCSTTFVHEQVDKRSEASDDNTWLKEPQSRPKKQSQGPGGDGDQDKKTNDVIEEENGAKLDNAEIVDTNVALMLSCDRYHVLFVRYDRRPM